MTTIRKFTIVVLILLNSVVLLGQIWPEGIPPFARTVNILFLGISLIYFLTELFKSKFKH